MLRHGRANDVGGNSTGVNDGRSRTELAPQQHNKHLLDTTSELARRSLAACLQPQLIMLLLWLRWWGKR